MRNFLKKNDVEHGVEPDPMDTVEAIIQRGAFDLPRPLIHGPSLYTDAQRFRMQALQVNIYKLRTQIYQASENQSEDVAMWLSYVEMYHQEMNGIVLDACRSAGLDTN